jgi:hypothetical protein
MRRWRLDPRLEGGYTPLRSSPAASFSHDCINGDQCILNVPGVNHPGQQLCICYICCHYYICVLFVGRGQSISCDNFSSGLKSKSNNF